MEQLQDRVALVTGAASGMGRATALALAARGAALMCTDIRKSAKGEGYEADVDVDTDDLIRRNGGKAEYRRCDVSAALDVEAAVAAAVEQFGRLDIMVNNAGIFTKLETIIDQSEADYDLTMTINAKGAWLGSKYALRQMIAQEPLTSGLRGRIINIASVGGELGLRGRTCLLRIQGRGSCPHPSARGRIRASTHRECDHARRYSDRHDARADVR